MCGLLDIRHAQKQGDLYLFHEVGDHGEPTIEVGRTRRMEPRNLEQWFCRIVDDLCPPAPYYCACGADFTSWHAVLEHCNLYTCRDCQRPTPKWDGWNYRCPPCDKIANPEYHAATLGTTTAAVADHRELSGPVCNEPTLPRQALRTMRSRARSHVGRTNYEVACAALSR